MKKRSKEINLLNISYAAKEDFEASIKKTTDINILLNRVKLNKKKELKKKIIFLFLLSSVISISAFFAII